MGLVRISLEMEQMADVKLKVLSVTGQMIYEFQSERTNKKEYLLDLSDRAAGLYIAQLLINGETVIQKIVLSN